jgi:hypothetical protein
MTYRAKDARIYPYNTGLKLGCELDIILTNENSEPLNASQFFDGKEIISVHHSGGGESQDDSSGHNLLKVKNGIVRMHSMHSYCRAYSVDNIWFMLKYLVRHLNKRAFISFVPAIYGEDVEGLPDDKAWCAGGHMRFTTTRGGIYDRTHKSTLANMTYKYDDESHARLLDNLRITVGLISLLLDRRESAEFRRQEYGPFNDKEFRKTKTALTYQTPSNFWLYSPMLAHLMFGAVRWAYFMTQNNFECDIWEGFESGDIKNAIHHSSYDTGMEIWYLMKSRIQEAGYKDETNPFSKKACGVLEMLFENGVGQLGDGIYKNWRMNRMLTKYRGHFDDLPSWENGAVNKLFFDDHPMSKAIKVYMETQSAER